MNKATAKILVKKAGKNNYWFYFYFTDFGASRF
jgi:hypothetical protein